ncbi:(deoxy)nucleoside triphosphate pyrophosphohydrolase [Salinactinospora qingdaonensis]|uniref:8-oxo-dGTP diphosphatase n=1 Tax=Salinactinospora qingdaonensis TaxID=702744 RepID=A0ABP7FJN9_9ACTN
MSDSLTVVGAAIVCGGALLAAQRASPPQLRGRWELPGGKVDPGETEEVALVRECQEELGVKIRPRLSLAREVALPLRPQASPALLRVWIADLVDGTPQPLEHLSLRWLCATALTDVDWLPADVPFLADIRPYLDCGQEQ